MPTDKGIAMTPVMIPAAISRPAYLAWNAADPITAGCSTDVLLAWASA
jgi:hypothetical protein